jgi:23S rRNA pseudouridine2605 synthase
MRLQKYLAKCGVASRRASEELIKQGVVSVNGAFITEMGCIVDVLNDKVAVNGKEVSFESQLVYILLNKPTGYVTTSKDQFDRDSVVDLISEVPYRVYPVGRLDYDTSGLLILTNDGDLTNKITHPKHKIYKTYIAKIVGSIEGESIERLKAGVQIEDYTTAPAEVELMEKSRRYSRVKISIREGKNRQVRKMFDTVGYKVIELERISIGDITLKDIECGKWRYLTDDEVKYLKEM